MDVLNLICEWFWFTESFCRFLRTWLLNVASFFKFKIEHKFSKVTDLITHWDTPNCMNTFKEMHKSIYKLMNSKHLTKEQIDSQKERKKLSSPCQVSGSLLHNSMYLTLKSYYTVFKGEPLAMNRSAIYFSGFLHTGQFFSRWLFLLPSSEKPLRTTFESTVESL